LKGVIAPTTLRETTSRRLRASTSHPSRHAHQPPPPPLPNSSTARPSSIGFCQNGRPVLRIGPRFLRRS
jgi:hypothetical protein